MKWSIINRWMNQGPIYNSCQLHKEERIKWREMSRIPISQYSRTSWYHHFQRAFPFPSLYIYCCYLAYQNFDHSESCFSSGFKDWAQTNQYLCSFRQDKPAWNQTKTYLHLWMNPRLRTYQFYLSQRQQIFLFLCKPVISMSFWID